MFPPQQWLMIRMSQYYMCRPLIYYKMLDSEEERADLSFVSRKCWWNLVILQKSLKINKEGLNESV